MSRRHAAGDDARHLGADEFLHVLRGRRRTFKGVDGSVVVLFDDVGYKTLALDVVRERGLLEPA